MRSGSPSNSGAASTKRVASPNTGHPARGLANGYVGKVTAAAGRIVPAIGAPEANPSDAPVAAPPAAAWDVFGDVGPVRGAFVTTVSIITPGGSK